MNTDECRCDDVSIELLLSDDTSAAAYETATRHVDRCVLCQEKLTRLAAGADWWNDAQRYLGGNHPVRWSPNLSQPQTHPFDQAVQVQTVDELVNDVLAPPSLPEMLGRLGRYNVERMIGTGGMGVVLKAHDGELNRPVAIKVLAAHLAHVGAARERFAREGRAAAAIVHEHVVAIHNVETEGRVPFLVMQFVPGCSLQARVDEDGPLPVEQILRIGTQAAAGLAAAHEQGLVHRDVKPANILLEESVDRAVLTDFGLARTIDDASLTRTGVLAGTPHYMSPEQAQGARIDHRSDLFGLGAVLYFTATGRPPFRADGAMAVLNRICHDRHRPVRDINTHIPVELADLIDQLLEKKPHRRLTSAAEVETRLAALLADWQQFGLQGRPLAFLRSRRYRRRVGSAAALALLATVVSITAWWSMNPPPPIADAPPSPVSRQALEQFVQRETDFNKTLHEVHETLERAEQPAFFAAPADDWQRNVEALRSELKRIETSPGLTEHNNENAN